MKSPKRKSSAGFTLVEIMVATAISLILVLGVVQIATSSIRAYNIAMSTVSTTAVSRQVLDTLESDIQSSVIKADGNVWMECFRPTGAGGSPDPTANSNFDTGACNTLILFSTPTDRDRFKPGATGSGRQEYKGDVCAVRYRLMNDTPLPAALSSEDKAYCLNRVVVNPEDTFDPMLKNSTESTNTQTLPQIIGAIKRPTPSSKTFSENETADIFGMNIVGMTPVFIFKRTDPTKTPSSWYFYAAPRSAVNDTFYQQNLKEGFSSQNDPNPNAFVVESFDKLKISGGKYCITDAAKPSSTPTPDPAWKDGTLAAVLISLTVVDETGADEIRALQNPNRGGAPKIKDDDWNRIIREHGHSFVRRINIPGN